MDWFASHAFVTVSTNFLVVNRFSLLLFYLIANYDRNLLCSSLFSSFSVAPQTTDILYSASICINETAAISGWLVGLCSDYLLHKSMHECPWTPKLTHLFLPHHTSFTPFRNHSWKHLRQPLYILAMRKFKFKIRLKSFKYLCSPSLISSSSRLHRC